MISSVGIANPPLAVYLFTLPVLLGRDPLIVTGFVALANVLGVWGCYRLGRKYWGAWPGILAALLLAASPWAVYYSRKVWSQDLLLPGVILLVALILAWLVEGRGWALAAALITLVALTQIHFAAIALVPLMAVLLVTAGVSALRGRLRVPLLRPLLVGAGLGAVTYLPYLAADAAAGWPNLRTLLSTPQLTTASHANVLNLALLNIGGRDIHALAGAQQYQRFLAGIVNLGYWPDYLEESLVVFSVAYLALRWWRNRTDGVALRRDGVLLLWLITPVLFFLVWKTEIYPHYLLPLYPAPYLALAIAAGDVVKLLRGKRARDGATPRVAAAVDGGKAPAPAAHRRGLTWAPAAASSLFLAILIGWQSYLSVAIFAFAGTHDTPGGLGAPLRVYRDIGRVIAGYVGDHPGTQVVALCPGRDPRWADPRWDACPAAIDFVAGSHAPLSYVNFNTTAPRPPEDATNLLVVVAPGNSRAGEEIKRFGQPLPDRSVAVREGGGEYRFFSVYNRFRDAAQDVATLGREGDAVLLSAAGQRATFDRFYGGTLPVIEAPRWGPGQDAAARLADLAGRYRRLFVVYRGSDAGDTQGPLDVWLDDHAYRALDIWHGDVRLALLATDPPPDAWSAPRTGGDLGGQLRLVSTILAPDRTQLAPGDVVQIRLSWQVLRPPEADYTLFLQMLDGHERVLAQRDAPLRDGNRATSAWRPGDEVVVRQGMLLPEDTAAGVYRLIAGLYRGDRPGLPRLSGPGGDFIVLDELEVRQSAVRFNQKTTTAAPSESPASLKPLP